MKLEDLVIPLRLTSSAQSCPILVRDILSHLLFLSDESHAEQHGNKLITEFYRTVAIDFLSAHGIVDASEVHSRVPNIVRLVLMKIR